jgi:hypothetical protein
MTIKYRRRPLRPDAQSGAAAGLFWVLAFLVFDREARRPRPHVFTGLVALLAVLFSHAILSGPWLHDAGLTLGRPHVVQPAHASPAAELASWRNPATRR